MRIRRTKKISIKIAIIIGIVELLAMALLFVAVNHSLTSILAVKAINDMNAIARDKAQLVETYIENCCDFVEGYSKTLEVREILQDKSNPKALKRIDEFTDKYGRGHIFVEGLYVAEWNTNVLSHINSEYKNKPFRPEAAAKVLEEQIRNHGKVFCQGVVTSPVTGKMVIPVYAPVFNEKNEAIGFAGGAFYTSSLGEKLEQITEKKIGYSLINAETKTFIFNDNQELAGQFCGDIQILDSIQYLKDSQTHEKAFNFHTKEKVVSCYYIAERDWVLTIEDSKQNVFELVKFVQEMLIAACLFITMIMIIICAFSVDYQTKPLRALTAQIDRLKANDFTRHEQIKKYCQREDEFGTIANAVRDLHSVLENQYHLFSELLEAQTVGTLVTDAEDNNVLLVNTKALELWGINPLKKNRLRMEDIKERFNEEEKQKIAQVRELAKKSKEEIAYETYAIHDDGTKVYFLSHAKSVTLSNGDNVIIFSFIDTTAQKNLEESLLILSETDSLTSISNRRSGEFKVRNAVSDGKKGMFCLFDANKFKYINDTFGHAVGDKVLIEIAKSMKKAFRTSDILIRLGGDEFVVFAPDINSQATGQVVLDRFMKIIEEIKIPELQGHKISISLGAVMIEGDETFEQMYTKADSLMYDCKKEGGNVYKFYE